MPLHSSHRHISAQPCTTTVALLKQLPEMVWPWSLPLDSILTQTSHSTFWLLAGLAAALTCVFYCPWLTWESVDSHSSLAYPTWFWLCLHFLFWSGLYSKKPMIQHPTKSKIYYNAHFLTKYYTNGFKCASGNILLNRKKKSGTRFFLTLKNTSTTEGC